MNQKQRAKWERTRVKGMWRFVLLYGVLLWGGLAIITTTVYSMIIGTFVSSNLRISVPVFLISGLMFGIALWLIGEYQYRKSTGNN